MKYAIPLLLALLLSGCDRDTNRVAAMYQQEVKPLDGKVIKAGLFRIIRSGGLVDSPHTSTGKAHLQPVIELVEHTDRIPLVRDAHMSLQYRIWNVPDGIHWLDLKRVLKHPPMTLPDGSVSSGSEYMIRGRVSVGQVIAYTGYGLNEDYEMVEGDWAFQIWYQDRLLVEQGFTTYRPDEVAAPATGNIPADNGV